MPIPILSGPYKTFRQLRADETFIEFEGSTITVPLIADVPDGKGGTIRKSEDIKMTAFMRLEVFPAYVNGLGTREFQFIIREWDTVGTCPLLNELFHGNPRGKSRKPTRDNPRAYQTVWMTWCLSHNFVKYDDDNGANFGHPDDLGVDNLTFQDFPDDHIYFQIGKVGKSEGYDVLFHNKAPTNGNIQALDVRRESKDSNHVVAMAEGVKPGTAFTATLPREMHERSIVALSRGNTVISAFIRPRQPVSIRWILGKNPTPGAVGRVRVVSPARSICTAHQRPDPGKPETSADFPARIMYAASYHIYLNNARFVQDKAGVAIADGVLEIPPRDVVVAFDKPHANTVLGRYLLFRPGWCTGMEPILEEDYREGLAFARALRQQSLAPEM